MGVSVLSLNSQKVRHVHPSPLLLAQVSGRHDHFRQDHFQPSVLEIILLLCHAVIQVGKKRFNVLSERGKSSCREGLLIEGELQCL